MNNTKIIDDRSRRILNALSKKYPGANVFDVDGRGEHFACEVEPISDHQEYDKAIEVILSSQPHKHLKMTQHYKILSGTLELHVGNKVIILKTGNTYIIEPNNIHWAKSNDECWVEIFSQPGWTKEDHLKV